MPALILHYDASSAIASGSYRWAYGVDLKGKRVAAVENGCSAAQFVPRISQDPRVQVINFSRTASWIIQRNYLSKLRIAAFRYLPFYQFLYRALIVLVSDMSWPIWPLSNKIIWRREAMSMKHIRTTAPEEYHDFLIPKYPFGCKRLISVGGYLKCLNEPNVELVYDPIKEITAKGVVCASGREHEGRFDTRHWF